MSTFKSAGHHVVAANIATVYGKLSDSEGIQNMADNIPAELKEKADIHIDGDNLAISTPQFGSITFKVSKRVHNEMIRLETTSSPLPFSIDILLSPEAESQTNIAVATKIELNPIIKPMISKPIQNMTDKFAEFLATIQY